MSLYDWLGGVASSEEMDFLSIENSSYQSERARMSGAALYVGIVSQKNTLVQLQQCKSPPGIFYSRCLPECWTQQVVFMCKHNPAEQQGPQSSETEHSLASLTLPLWLNGRFGQIWTGCCSSLI